MVGALTHLSVFPGTQYTKATRHLLFAAYLATNAPGFSERAARLAEWAVIAPLALTVQLLGAAPVKQLAYASCRNIGEDRLVVLSREFFELVLRSRMSRKLAIEVAEARARNDIIALGTAFPEPIARQLARELGAVDFVFCNRLEFVGGWASGKLVEPVYTPSRRHPETNPPARAWLSTPQGQPLAVDVEAVLKDATHSSGRKVTFLNA